MSRYIDADNLTKKMQERYDDLSSRDGFYDHFTQGYGDALSAVENEPTADVAKVVRCKDCKYWDAVKSQKYKDTGICTPPRKDLGGYCVRRGATNCNDFCSQGERRKDNAEVH